MRLLRFLCARAAAMLSTKVIQRHPEPTHPAVIPTRLRKGVGLAPRALIAEATGPVMTVDRTNIEVLVAQPGQPLLEAPFPICDDPKSRPYFCSSRGCPR